MTTRGHKTTTETHKKHHKEKLHDHRDKLTIKRHTDHRDKDTNIIIINMQRDTIVLY